jgi:hypothetical protein
MVLLSQKWRVLLRCMSPDRPRAEATADGRGGR